MASSSWPRCRCVWGVQNWLQGRHIRKYQAPLRERRCLETALWQPWMTAEAADLRLLSSRQTLLTLGCCQPGTASLWSGPWRPRWASYPLELSQPKATVLSK
jgi:hypothetical protein